MWQSLNSWLSKAQQQKLTFDKGGKDIVLFEGKCSFGRVGAERG